MVYKMEPIEGIARGAIHFVLGGEEVNDPGESTFYMQFQDGAALRASYWRLIKHNKVLISSFDDGKVYGLNSPLNAMERLHIELKDKDLVDIHLNKENGDLLLYFTSELKFEVFNFTGYEAWQLIYSDGRQAFSNHILD